MKLKKYEIDAVVTEINNKIKQNLKVPNFNSRITEEKKIFNEISKIKEQINILNDRLNALRNKSIIKYNSLFDETIILKSLKEEFYRNNLPSNSTIQNAVILSNNKDLKSLVEEIVAKYTN